MQVSTSNHHNTPPNQTVSGAFHAPLTGPYQDTSQLYEGEQSFTESLRPHPYPVDIEQVLGEMVSTIKKYCVMSEEEAQAISLWIASSYLINSFRIFPKLTLVSPERRCGKTTALEVIEALCRDPMMVSNVTSAVIYRCTKEHQPALLIDEADTFIKNGSLDMNGIINSGHNKSGATIMRCVGDESKPTTFSTWMPMILASIGNLSDTIMDRSIVIKLRRKKATESVARVPSNLKDNLKPIREKIARWCLDNQANVASSQIDPPDIGNDRAQDNWVPAFAVAALSGPHWEKLCDKSYRALTQPIEQELPTILLGDIRSILKGKQKDKISSAQLQVELAMLEDSPWQALPDGKKLSGVFIARLLRPYGIHSRDIRFSEGVKKGYKREDMEDAFERYL